MPDIRDLREDRGKLVEDARRVLDKAEAEKRELTDEETAKWDEMIGKSDALGAQIRRLEKQEDLEREAARLVADTTDTADPTDDAEQRMLAFRRALAFGRESLSSDEIRALQVDDSAAGGYLVAPQQFVNTLIKGIDDAVFIRSRGQVFTLEPGQSLGAPSLAADPADSAWTSELATGDEDSTMAFGTRELRPHPLAKRLKVSNTLLRNPTANAETIVNDRLTYKFGITEEKAFLTGSGASQPLGVFTASDSGISTSRDVSTGNATTSIKADGLLEAKYKLKAQYWMLAEWLFHRDAVKQIAKLKDGEGQYLWRESLRAGEPDMLLGRPVMMSEFAPNTFTTGEVVGLLGDFSQYWIADSQTVTIQRLVELYAATNQTGFIGRLETDGMPVLEEAFARVKLG